MPLKEPPFAPGPYLPAERQKKPPDGPKNRLIPPLPVFSRGAPPCATSSNDLQHKCKATLKVAQIAAKMAQG
jgi:hypothetical protein